MVCGDAPAAARSLCSVTSAAPRPARRGIFCASILRRCSRRVIILARWFDGSCSNAIFSSVRRWCSVDAPRFSLCEIRGGVGALVWICVERGSV